MTSSFLKSSKCLRRSNHQHNSNFTSFFHESSIVNNSALNNEFALFYDTHSFNNIVFDLFHNIFERIRKTRSKITQNNSITSFNTINQKAFDLLKQKHSEHLSTFFNFSKWIILNCIREKLFNFIKQNMILLKTLFVVHVTLLFLRMKKFH
jgi:GTPase SAR1 family protein